MAGKNNSRLNSGGYYKPVLKTTSYMTEAQKEYINNHSVEFTVPELSELTGLTEIQVENYCHRNKLRYRYMEKSRIKPKEVKVRTYPPRSV